MALTAQLKKAAGTRSGWPLGRSSSVHAVLSFAMLIYATTITIQQDGGIENGQLALLFGATGMITLSVARVSWFFNRAFDLVEAALRHMTDQRIEP